MSGDTRQSPNGWYDVELLIMNRNSGSTVYVAPGTKLQFETDDSHTSGDWYLEPKSSSISFAADQNGNWGQSNGYKTVEIALNAQPGDTATLKVITGSGYWWTQTYTRKLVVMSRRCYQTCMGA